MKQFQQAQAKKMSKLASSPDMEKRKKEFYSESIYKLVEELRQIEVAQASRSILKESAFSDIQDGAKLLMFEQADALLFDVEDMLKLANYRVKVLQALKRELKEYTEEVRNDDMIQKGDYLD